MSASELMISAIKHDFNVELISNSGDSCLFAALRKGGNSKISSIYGPWQSHIMGAWHFVSATVHGNAFQTKQWHVPRYAIAAAFSDQNKLCSSGSHDQSTHFLGSSVSLNSHSLNNLELVLGNEAAYRLPEWFVLELKKDIPALDKARSRVAEKEEFFCLPRLKTHAGHPIESKSRDLLEAIAFEKTTYPRLQAGNFGVYSAFCTFRDFETSIKFPDCLIGELLETQFGYDPAEVPDEVHELFLKIQHQLLSKPIWGRGIKSELKAAAAILAEGIGSLSRTQRVQFILMNGMHSAGLFLPLATVVGLSAFETYADYMCKSWQPDSPEEQERRIQTAYIKLYGELTTTA